jgi:hypothetical protein
MKISGLNTSTGGLRQKGAAVVEGFIKAKFTRDYLKQMLIHSTTIYSSMQNLCVMLWQLYAGLFNRNSVKQKSKVQRHNLDRILVYEKSLLSHWDLDGMEVDVLG